MAVERVAVARPRVPALVVPALTMLAAVLATMLVLAPQAAAHDTLIDSDPADGETVAQSPSEVTLTFNNELIDSTSAIAITDGSGETVVEGEPTLDGSTATLPVTEELPDGDYTLTWSVVSSDGHRTEGDFAFSVEGGGAEQASEESTDDSTSDSDSTGADEAASPDQVSEGSGTSSEESGSPVNMPAWVGWILAVAILGGIIATIVRLRRRR